MKKTVILLALIIPVTMLMGCGPSYKIKPVSFRSPETAENAISVAGAHVSARAYVGTDESKEAFGFDIRGAGMLPVQVVFDNQGYLQLEINASQTFLEDTEGNLWPILSDRIAYERATKYAETNEVLKESAMKGLWGAAAGAVIGAAIGIATDEGVAEAAGKGAAVGAAAGATLGGAGAYGSGDARRDIIDDLHEKSLENAVIEPQSISHGLLFFPGEAKTAKKLRLQVVEAESGTPHLVNIFFY